MQIKRIGRIHYLAAEFNGSAGSIQGFTTRHEGVSRPPYNSLNLGTTTQDQQHSVEGNRNLLMRAFGVAENSLLTARQVHGSDILIIDSPNEDVSHFLSVDSDAIITNQPDLMIGVCVADCVPILLLDPLKGVVAAIHAGWQGSAGRLTSKTVAAMKSHFGCDPASLQAAIGPCISPCCYEVDAPVRHSFLQSGLPWDAVAVESGEGKWKLDLAATNRQLLVSAGVPAAAIQSADMCVSCQRELFFSHRRDNGETGRQMGFIMLKAVQGS